MVKLDLTGHSFGRLTVLGEAPRDLTLARSLVRWRCRCACGTDTLVVADALRSGNTRSCGCLNSEQSRARNLQRAEAAQSPDRRAARRRRDKAKIARWRAKHPERVRRWMTRATMRHRRKYPEKTKAHGSAMAAVHYAIAKGLLVRPSACSVCHQPGRIQAHHHRGYAPEHRLDVQWLCGPCHRAAHTTIK